MKIIYSKENALEKIHTGVNKVGDIVRATYGPEGTNVLIGKKYVDPQDTNDGYKVIKEIELDDETENMAVRIMEVGARRTNEEAGDSTTTTIMLIQDIFNTGYEHLQRNVGGIVKPKVSAMDIKREIQEACKVVIEKLKESAIQVDSLDRLNDIAFVAAEDKNIAEIVSKVVWEVGKDGAIKIEDGSSISVESSISDGMEIKSGFTSDWMATNDKRESIVMNPLVLVMNESISDIGSLSHLINLLVEEKVKDLVIFATDFDNAVLEAFKFDRIRSEFRVLAIKVPAWDKGLFEDICTVTGARLGELVITSLGKADKIIANKIKTTIFGGVEDKSEALKLLKIDLDITEAPFEKEKIKERIARVSGKVGIIKVGAMTPVDQGRLADKIDDCVHATQGALQEGCVSGAGIALKNIASEIYENILSEPLKSLNRQINMPTISLSVIDSVKSLRVAIESACSTACTLLTTGTTIVEKNESNSEQDN